MLLAESLTERIIGLAMQTYLRMSGIRVGLIFNFNASRLIDGLRRFVV